jgi:diguanylate cyclase (GGDEF)-like protein
MPSFARSAGKPFRSLIGFILRSFQTKVLTLVLCGVLVPSAVLWLFTVRDTEQFQTSQTRETFNSLLSNARREINYWHKDRTVELERLWRSNAFIKPFEGFFFSNDEKQRADFLGQMSKYFRIVQDNFPLYQEFVVLDDSGKIVASSGTTTDDDAQILADLQLQSGDQVLISNAFLTPERDAVFQWVMVPVELAGNTEVAVFTRMNLEGLGDVVNGDGDKVGEIYVTDGSGRSLTHAPHGQEIMGTRSQVNMLGRKAIDVPMPATDADSPAIHRFVRDVVDEHGRRINRETYLASRLYMPERGWWLVCEAREGEVVAPMVTRKNRLLLADALICVFFVLIALKLSRSLLKPLTALSEGARRINEGMVGVEIPIVGHDEIAQAISAFNDMAKRIAVSEVKLQATNRQLETQNEKLQGLNAQLKKISMTDGLTGLFNHRHFWNMLNTELTRANLYQGDLALVLLDIDDFKQVNDRFGHSAGDRLISQIAGVLKDTVRETDIVARYGGEEFAVLLPDTSYDGLMTVSEKIRTAIEKMVFKVPDTDITLSVTVSVGVSVFKESRREFFNAADRALYRSKTEGKNRVSFALAEA